MSVIVHRFGNGKTSIIQCLKNKVGDDSKGAPHTTGFLLHIWWHFLTLAYILWFVPLPSCRQTPSWQKGERGRARTCSSCVCGNLSCSSGSWRRYDPICEASEHTAPQLDLLQYRYLQEVNTKKCFYEQHESFWPLLSSLETWQRTDSIYINHYTLGCCLVWLLSFVTLRFNRLMIMRKKN